MRSAILISEMSGSSLTFKVRGVALNQENQVPIVLLHNTKKNLLLPLVVGPFEASAIIIELENVQPPRPLTHDLLAQFFQKHGFRLLQLQIYGRLDDRYLARIHYRVRLSTHTMEVRPSDGIALAIRLEAPILVSDELVSNLALSNSINSQFDLSRSEILYLESEKPIAPMM